MPPTIIGGFPCVCMGLSVRPALPRSNFPKEHCVSRCQLLSTSVYFCQLLYTFVHRWLYSANLHEFACICVSAYVRTCPVTAHLPRNAPAFALLPSTLFAKKQILYLSDHACLMIQDEKDKYDLEESQKKINRLVGVSWKFPIWECPQIVPVLRF